jgi:hypothetical protein
MCCSQRGRSPTSSFGRGELNWNGKRAKMRHSPGRIGVA